ncbi:MAG TPA: class I SAM-dependent methyltransferase [Terriglobales bacterium]|nr:class I SAM-dependent methyltransferase [Terriglobales bacterium]
MNVSALKLAFFKPELVRPYVSFTLRKYDELVGNGLPLKSPVKDMDPRETLTVPARFQSGGGTDAREILVLAAATKLVRPRRIFEIGTYNGRTTAVFIMNAPSNCQVYTLDLPPQSNASSDYLASDAELVETRSTETFLQRARLGRRYRQIYCNSMDLDAEIFRDSIELGFIDGAHTLEFVRNDTEKMAIMMAQRGLVFWHDYGGRGEFRPLSEYLESLPIEMYRVPGTSLAWTTAEEIKKLVSPRRISEEECLKEAS